MSMAPECGCAYARPATRTPVRVAWGALVPGLAAAVLPKCPLCLAAYLSVIGVSASAAAPWVQVLHPASIVVAAIAVGVVLARLVRRSRLTRRSWRYPPVLAVVAAAGVAAVITLRAGALASRITAVAGLVAVLTWAELAALRRPRA